MNRQEIIEHLPETANKVRGDINAYVKKSGATSPKDGPSQEKRHVRSEGGFR